MSERTYLNSAKSALRTAKIAYQYRTDDEMDLNWISFLVQQSIELALKHYIEFIGKRPRTTHDILELLEQIDTGDFDELYPWSGTITEMESKTRYIKNHRSSIRIVNQVFDIANGVIDKVEKLINDHKEIRQDNLTSLPLYLQVFPDFDDHIEIPSGWYDSSSTSDLSPSISKELPNSSVLKILVDYKNQAKRHPPKSMRFDLIKDNQHVRSFARWDDVIAAAVNIYQ